MSNSKCGVCENGVLVASPVRQMRRGVVILGYSVAAILFAIGGLALVRGLGIQGSAISTKVGSDLTAAGLSRSIQQSVWRQEGMPETEFAALTEHQRWVVDQARVDVSHLTEKAGMNVVAQAALVTSCPFLLLGGTMAYMLTLKRSGLICESCQAVVLPTRKLVAG